MSPTSISTARSDDNLDLAAAAPLLCAGVTMWSPLVHWKVGKGTKVGIVGLGGLGHMGLKLAFALGAEVTLFSRSAGKEEEARLMGAHKVVISTDAQQMAAVANYFDVIIDTVPIGLDGTVVLVGHIGEISNKISTIPLIFKRKSVAGSVIGGIRETQEMLDFCGKHNIVSEIEKISFQDIDTAYGRMEKSDVRYRFVIDNTTL